MPTDLRHHEYVCRILYLQQPDHRRPHPACYGIYLAAERGDTQSLRVRFANPNRTYISGGSKSMGDVIFQLTVPVVAKVRERTIKQLQAAAANSRAAAPESGN